MSQTSHSTTESTTESVGDTEWKDLHLDLPPTPPSRDGRSIERQHRIRRWGLALADSVGIGIGIACSYAFEKLNDENILWALAIIPIWIFVAKLYNLYDRDHRRIRHSTIEEIPPLVATAAITVVLVKGMSELLPLPQFTSASLIIVGGVGVICVFVLRGLVRNLFRHRSSKQRTIIVGAGEKAGLVARRLQTLVDGGIELVGYVGPSPNGTHRGPKEFGVAYFGPVDLLTQIAESESINRVVIADDALTMHEVANVIAICRNAEASVTMVPAHSEVLGPGTELNRIGEVPMLDFHFSIPPRSTLAIKRVLDFIVSGALLLASSPVLLLSALLIKLDSKGTVMFRQVRVGQDGKEFNIFKLRTMVADAEDNRHILEELNNLDGPVFKAPNDPRITRVGKFLRRSSIDEIPQFFNVLKGDMSLVGPRPEVPSVVDMYTERQRQRLSVKPGITGPMQIAGRGSLNFEERLALERDYLDNLTIATDLAILLRTPRAVVKGEGAF